MQFVNPIEILSLQDMAVNEIDAIIIRKAKRKIHADIELSDTGFFLYKGIQINKSDVDKAIIELDDKEKIEFFHFLSNNKNFNDFLAKGDIKLFNSFKQESIFKLPSFINFISPYFSEKYDKALFNAFQDNDESTFRRIVSVKPLVSSLDIDNTYKSVSIAIKGKIKEVEELTRDIQNEECNYYENDINEVFSLIQNRLNVNIINALPQYFQSLRNCVSSPKNSTV